MNDPVNSTRPFVPQLNFSSSAQSGTTRTSDTRYTSFNTVYSSHDRSYTPTAGKSGSPTPAYTSNSWTQGGGTGSDWRQRWQTGAGGSGVNKLGDAGDEPRFADRFSRASGAASSTRWGADEYVSISPRRYQRGGDWRGEADQERVANADSYFGPRTGANNYYSSNNNKDTSRVDPNIFSAGAGGRSTPAWERREGLPFGTVHSTERGQRTARTDRAGGRHRRRRRGGSLSSSPSASLSSGSYGSSGSESRSSRSDSDDSTNSGGRRQRQRRGRGRRRHARDDDDSDYEDYDRYDTQADNQKGGFGGAGGHVLGDDVDLDAQPVIPPDILQRSQQALFQWNRHPQHSVVLSLLQSRGIYLPRYRELINYHMSELFLHYLGICCGGSYFVYYAPGKWPKERFFRIRMMPRDRRTSSKSDLIPFLSWTMHQTGVQVVDSVPLEQLVGITATPRAASFRPFLISPETIIGCREGRGHRARLPVDGAFTLWFYDGVTSASRSVDLLTCDGKVYDVWTKCFRGIISVNSSSVVQTPLTSTGMSVTMAQLMRVAQKANEDMMAQMNTG